MCTIKIFINNKTLINGKKRVIKILLYKNISIHERFDGRSRWENPFNVIDMLINARSSHRGR